MIKYLVPKNAWGAFGRFAISLIVALAFIGPFYDKAESATIAIGVVVLAYSLYNLYKFVDYQFFK